MADLLRSGYTMLNMACPVCNNPIFRKKEGMLFCPVCDKKVIVMKKDDSFQNSNVKESDKNKNNFKINQENQFDYIISKLKGIILEKINWIAEKLKDETQIDLIEKYLKILSDSYELFKNIV